MMIWDRTLTANIRRRRGGKVAINVPIFFDSKTEKPFIDHSLPLARGKWPEDKGSFAPSSRSIFWGEELMRRERSSSRGRFAEFNLYGRDGIRNGLLLSPNHLSSLLGR